MGTVFDYLDWRGDLTFSACPLCEVDSLIFSMISYIDFTDIVSPPESVSGVSLMAAANSFFSRYPTPKDYPMGILIPKEIVKLFAKMKDTPRFRNVEIHAFVNDTDVERQIQFSAVTFLLDDGTVLVTYRGTDDTLIGWKEDLNMTFLPVVPSQSAAVAYLKSVADVWEGPITLTGHSKGGNLAVYAAVHSEERIRSRITDVFSNDGPGFGTYILDDPAYLEMRPRIHSIVPQSSVVGMLLEHDENYTVVKSRQKSGLLQHNGLSWEVLGNAFVHLEEISAESRRIDKTVNRLIKDMTPEQREEFSEAAYQLFSVEGAQTLTDFVAVRKSWLAHSKSLDPKVHKTVQRMLSALVALNTKEIVGGFLKKGVGKTPRKGASEAVPTAQELSSFSDENGAECVSNVSEENISEV
ncbi:MAG: DUF2974 domain-containing protein [Ruminococcaceae bacterium]|nr:DUF2974 domain-containing protein [Oscillospiraceae bacterium]